MRIAIDLTSLADNFTSIERYALEVVYELIKLYREDNKYILVFKNEIHEKFIDMQSWDNIQCDVITGSGKLYVNQISLQLHMYRLKADKYIFPAFPCPLLFWKKEIYTVIYDLACWNCPETMKWKSKWL